MGTWDAYVNFKRTCKKLHTSIQVPKIARVDYDTYISDKQYYHLIESSSLGGINLFERVHYETGVRFDVMFLVYIHNGRLFSNDLLNVHELSRLIDVYRWLWDIPCNIDCRGFNMDPEYMVLRLDLRNSKDYELAQKLPQCKKWIDRDEIIKE